MGEVVGVADKRLLIKFYNNGRKFACKDKKTLLKREFTSDQDDLLDAQEHAANPQSFDIDLYYNGECLKKIAYGIQKVKLDRRRLTSTPLKQILSDLSDVNKDNNYVKI